MMRQHFFSIFGPQIQAGVLQEDVRANLAFPVQMMNQVHGLRIAEISRLGEAIEADALVSRHRGIRLMVKTADCIPLVIADEEVGLVAAVHAGWRGLTADIVPLVLERLSEMGASLERLKVGVGPSLGVECAVFSNPQSEIPEKYHWAIRGGEQGQTRLRRAVDLPSILRKQLEEAGVLMNNVEWMDICTSCNKNWFSWRRGRDEERFGTWIMLVQR